MPDPKRPPRPSQLPTDPPDRDRPRPNDPDVEPDQPIAEPDFPERPDRPTPLPSTPPTPMPRREALRYPGWVPGSGIGPH